MRFSQCPIVGIIKYVAFLDWLLLLSNIHLTSLHVFLWFDNSSLALKNNSVAWMHHSFVYPFTYLKTS